MDFTSKNPFSKPLFGGLPQNNNMSTNSQADALFPKPEEPKQTLNAGNINIAADSTKVEDEQPLQSKSLFTFGGLTGNPSASTVTPSQAPPILFPKPSQGQIFTQPIAKTSGAPLFSGGLLAMNPNKQAAMMPKPDSSQQASSATGGASSGEMILGVHHTYHSKGILAQQVQSDSNLSIEIQSKRVKAFQSYSKQKQNNSAKQTSKSLICFLEQDERNLTFLVNQHEQILSVLGKHELRNNESIADFTVRGMKYLFILCKASVQIFDCQELIQSREAESLTFHSSIDLQTDELFSSQPVTFSRIEIANNGNSFIVFAKSPQRTDLLLVDLSADVHGSVTRKQRLLDISGYETRQIVDFEIWQSYIALLYDKNTIVVVDVVSEQVVFKTTYADATDMISKIFYLGGDDSDAGALLESDSPNKNTASDQSKNDEIESNRKLSGYFLLVETKDAQSSSSTSTSTNAIASTSRNGFRKLHLAELQSHLTMNAKAKDPTKQQVSYKLEQVDQLTVTDQAAKIVEFDHRNQVLFMLNRERNAAKQRLFAVQVHYKSKNDSDSEHSDDDRSNTNKQGGASSKVVFGYISEVRPLMGSGFGASASTQTSSSSSSGKATFMKILCSAQQGDEQQKFFVYTDIGGKEVSVFPREFDGVCPLKNSIGQTRASEATKNPMKAYDDFQKKFGLDAESLKQKDQERKDEELKKQPIIPDADETLRQIEEDVKRESDDMTRQILSKVNQEMENLAMISSTCLEDHNIILNQNESSFDGLSDQSSGKQQTVSKKKQKKLNKQKEQAEKMALQSSGNSKKQDQTSVPLNMNQQKTKEASKSKTGAASTSQPATIAQTVATQQQNQAPVNPTRKLQQDSIIENYQELNKKYHELAMKMNTLQQQVQRQAQFKLEVEQIVQRAIRDQLPELIKKQVEESVVPMLQHQMQLESQLKHEMIPKIEARMADMFKQLITQHLSTQLSSNFGGVLSQTANVTQNTPNDKMAGTNTLNEAKVRQMVAKEFKEVMTSQIVPKMEQLLRQMITQSQQALQQVNGDFSKKLKQEERRNQAMLSLYETNYNHLISAYHHHQHQLAMMRDHQYSVSAQYAPSQRTPGPPDLDSSHWQSSIQPTPYLQHQMSSPADLRSNLSYHQTQQPAPLHGVHQVHHPMHPMGGYYQGPPPHLTHSLSAYAVSGSPRNTASEKPSKTKKRASAKTGTVTSKPPPPELITRYPPLSMAHHPSQQMQYPHTTTAAMKPQNHSVTLTRKQLAQHYEKYGQLYDDDDEDEDDDEERDQNSINGEDDQYEDDEDEDDDDEDGEDQQENVTDWFGKE